MKKILLAGLMLIAICRPSSAATGNNGRCFDFMFEQFGNCEFKAGSPAWRRVSEWREDFYKAYAAYKKPHNAKSAINACNALYMYFPGTMQQQDRIENDFDCNRSGARAMLYYLWGACLYKLASTMPEGEEKETILQRASDLQEDSGDAWVRNTELNYPVFTDSYKATAKFRVFMKMVNAQ